MKVEKSQFLIFWHIFGSIMTFAFIVALPSLHVKAQERQDRGGYTIRRDVNLVVLPTTVLDKKGQFVDGLTAKDFVIFENKILQKLDIARREDVPVSLGLVIDNSGSMRDKREGVNAAALTFVETSNFEDETFVVNFSDEFILEGRGFTSSIIELKEALERVGGRGNTALYDAIIGSMDYLHKYGQRDKKVLLVVTDGIDHASTFTLQKTLAELQKSDVIVYTIGIFGPEDDRGEVRRARSALQEIAKATGGLALFPGNTRGEITDVCERVAHDIRDQYTLGYYSSMSASDTQFREVKITAKDLQGRTVTVRARPGYFPKPAPVQK